MPAGKRHDLLCVSCNEAVHTLYDYPERACSRESSLGIPGSRKFTHVSCTRAPGNEQCERGVHYDELMQKGFTTAIPVRKGAWGNIGRA